MQRHLKCCSRSATRGGTWLACAGPRHCGSVVAIAINATSDTGNLVIDHYFRLPQPEPMAHPCWKLAWELIEKGRCWVKLSALYHQSHCDDVSDMAALITGFLRDATERVLWGSHWPHPNLISANKNMPDDALILSKIYHWAHNDQVRHKLFVENPAELYRFN